MQQSFTIWCSFERYVESLQWCVCKQQCHLLDIHFGDTLLQRLLDVCSRWQWNKKLFEIVFCPYESFFVLVFRFGCRLGLARCAQIVFVYSVDNSVAQSKHNTYVTRTAKNKNEHSRFTEIQQNLRPNVQCQRTNFGYVRSKITMNAWTFNTDQSAKIQWSPIWI